MCWILTGLFGGDIDWGAGGPCPTRVVGSDRGKVDGVGFQPCDGLGSNIPADSDLANHGFSGVIGPI